MALIDCGRSWSEGLPGDCLGPLEGVGGKGNSIKNAKSEYGDADKGQREDLGCIQPSHVGNGQVCEALEGFGED